MEGQLDRAKQTVDKAAQEKLVADKAVLAAQELYGYKKPQPKPLDANLTVEQHIHMYARLKGIPEEQVSDKLNEVVAAVGLTEKLHTKSTALSGGMKRKLSLSCALVGGKEVSKVLFLDASTDAICRWL